MELFYGVVVKINSHDPANRIEVKPANGNYQRGYVYHNKKSGRPLEWSRKKNFGEIEENLKQAAAG